MRQRRTVISTSASPVKTGVRVRNQCFAAMSSTRSRSSSFGDPIIGARLSTVRPDSVASAWPTTAPSNIARAAALTVTPSAIVPSGTNAASDVSHVPSAVPASKSPVEVVVVLPTIGEKVAPSFDHDQSTCTVVPTIAPGPAFVVTLIGTRHPPTRPPTSGNTIVASTGSGVANVTNRERRTDPPGRSLLVTVRSTTPVPVETFGRTRTEAAPFDVVVPEDIVTMPAPGGVRDAVNDADASRALRASSTVKATSPGIP